MLRNRSVYCGNSVPTFAMYQQMHEQKGQVLIQQKAALAGIANPSLQEVLWLEQAVQRIVVQERQKARF